MRRNIIYLLCLLIFLQTNLFAQISSNYHSMVKVANEKVHPRTSKIAMVNDSVSVSYMYGIDDVNVGYHNFTTWDKNATYNEYECESLIKKNYTAQSISLNIRSDSLHREPGELNLLERSGIVKEIEYRIKCKIQK